MLGHASKVTKLDHLLLFFPTELFEQITVQSNLYHDQVNESKQPKSHGYQSLLRK